METTPIWLAGYDNKGAVYIDGEHIIRELYPEYRKELLEIFKLYQKYNLEQLGIVKTELHANNKLLRHKKNLISYPFEWTANMYKDAVLFHLDLFLKLDKYDLTLKDAIPNNVVFNFSVPVFVDFLSIIQKKNIGREAWIINNKHYNDLRFVVFDSMFIPYMLIPLMAMTEKKYEISRDMLSGQACNCGRGQPRWCDLYLCGLLLKHRLWDKTDIKNFFKQLISRINERPKFIIRQCRLLHLLATMHKVSFYDFCLQLLQLIESVNVTPPKSGYISYYDDKDEIFDLNDQSSWGQKQKTFVNVIDADKPETMLDIGANTGWFSILSARRGIKVISTDADEASIDKLYIYSKLNKLPILPLVIPFSNMTRQFFGVDYNSPEYRNRNFSEVPLYLPATERLMADTVLCLGLLHHLILGDGMPLANVISILSKLTKKTLLLEYVDLQDPLIQSELSFFKHITNYSPNIYNIEAVIREVGRSFKSCEVLDSHPDTRKILVCRK